MVAEGHVLSPDTQAVLLLCGSFTVKSDAKVKPLTPSQYNRVESWLRAGLLRPGDLLSQEGIELLGQARDRLPDADASLVLLERGVAMALAVEKWANQGIWIVSRSDPEYPGRWHERLQHNAPPLLFGVGRKNLLSQEGLAVIGSRKADAGSLAFSRMMGQRCARDGIQVISGGAKGVDQEAMLAALGQGGTVVGIVSDNLGRATVSGKYRQAIREGRLVLLSACVPEAHFQTGNAMARNKLIYALADWALVVCCEDGTGGTWAGATENLKHGWAPLLVRTGVEVAAGNQQLIEAGGLPLEEEKVRHFKGGLQDLLQEADWQREQGAGEVGQDLEPEVVAQAGGRPDESSRPMPLHDAARAFWEEQVWPTLSGLLHTRGKLTVQQFVEELGIEKAQAQAWLKRALGEKKVKKLTKPVRYIQSSPQQRSLLEEP
jgi:predicted Rossmann fold nucleotide-binding protein DprA/Smf involved in DNA uptake